MKETFAPGDKVYLIHLEEEAVVTRLNGADMVYVKLEDMEIPVYCTDITRSIPKSNKGEERKVNVPLTEKKGEIKKPDKETVVKGDTGFFIAFDPVKRHGDIEQFRVNLANDTSEPASFSYRFFLGDEIHFQIEKIVLPYQVFLLHVIDYDTLNEMPAIDLLLRDVMNNRFHGEFNQRIKPQNFFNKLSVMPLTGTEAYVYKVNVKVQKEVVEQPVKPKRVDFDPEVLKQMMMDSVTAKDAEVSPASGIIDVHIEALTKDFNAMSNAEMIHLQLEKFHQALDRAVANGLNSFYVIHGVGSGKLKREIHRLLRNYPSVKSFNNDYHPKYGYGATEVVLK